MRQKYYLDPFAVSGDKTAVPNAADPDGFVSYTLGYTFDYERLLDGSDPLAKFPTRQNLNYVLNAQETNIQQYQQNGLPEFITSANNGGTPFTYGAGAQVLYSASGNPPFVAYVSLVNGNADTPPSSKWVALISALTTPVGANPTATAGPTAVNGSASTWMRSDGAPAVRIATISQTGLVQPDNVTIGISAGVISIKEARRTLLTANTDFYVSTSGNDANNGLTVGTPWLTFDHALKTLNSGYDFDGWTVTLHVAGAFTTTLSSTGVQTGQVTPLIIDGGGTASITVASGSCVQALNGASLQVQNIGLSQGSAGPIDAGLYAGPGGSITGGAGLAFGVCGGTGILANGAGANLQMTASFSINNNIGENFASAASTATLGVSGGITVNITAAITYVAFVNAVGCGVINWPVSVTIGGTGVGSTIGARYGISANGVISTTGSNPLTYFPGNVAGPVAPTPTGGQYS